MNIVKKLLSLTLALVTAFSCSVALISCGTTEIISNETTRLVLSTSELDGVFNPFYSSSAADGSIIGMTQIGMISADKEGKPICGEDESCVVLDYDTEFVTDPVTKEVKNTIYRFVLKNDLKFSNGSPLTMKDVLFNLYVYLDPAYYGSTTIYSTDIVGLDEYRTQTDNESIQEGFNEQFDQLAADRIYRLRELVEIIYDEKGLKSYTDAKMTEELTKLMNEICPADAKDTMEPEEYEAAKKYLTVVEDYNLAKKFFREELQTDYTNSKGTAEDISYTDKDGNEVTLTTDTEAFFFNEGLITWDKKKKEFVYSLDENCKNMTEKEAIDAVYNTYVPNKIDVVVTAWGTALELRTHFSLLEKQEYFNSIDKKDKITNISGIRFANRTESTQFKGKTYEVPTYNKDGSVKSGNEVLEITINEVDPKAIWNFGFTVAPMYYYSSEEEIEKFDYTSNFGVAFGSIDFQNKVIKNPDKIGVPVGAGPYKATTRTGDGANVTAGTFKADNVVYFERNTYFEFPVKIKYVNYQVVSTNLMLDALYSGDVHFVEPSCEQKNIDSIAKRKENGEGFDSTDVMTNGYGYIGINAEKVPDLAVRQAIMYAINTELAVEYYQSYAHPITRPMTKASWAYPLAADKEGQFYAFDKTGATSKALVEEAGYILNERGVWENDDGHELKYTFTVAGDSTDHPAYMALKTAAEILNKVGFDIEVKTDINALKKLNNGDLTVWAAAWGAGVDPDMYQVYHIDSTAGSVNNWGYRAIKANAGGKYDTELQLVKDLSELIDLARTKLDEKERAPIYAQALDLVMQLAVELPTYQRSDLFAYNTDIIDVSTLTDPDDLTPYNGPLSRLWEVSLKETKTN